ncbi:hydroxymethylglutaryl-CoA synthase [Candidatus Peregrinibacteria bacterium]|nr:hydroxymethylglutaryl-CoA synthase [Candidatus Peregrinibacteria bacterium]
MKSAIISFGRYLPRYRIKSAEIAAHWGKDPKTIEGSSGIHEKTVAGKDEDSFTMAFEAAKVALEYSSIKPTEISACFVGSESHPYAVKPTSAMLVQALELDPFSHAADLEFACKAGTAGIQIVDSMVRSGQVQYGLAIGTDRAQARPGDALEYTAAAGAAAFILGPTPNQSKHGSGQEKSTSALCRIEKTLSFTTDTPDFWRSQGEKYPEHAGRFTGEPGYLAHVREALRGILETCSVKPSDVDHLILHMPNAKFPLKIAKEFGFTKEQIQTSFIVPSIGNTYSACSPIGLTYVLEKAKKGEIILMVSYGSGAGSDAFLMTMLRDGSPLPPDKREVVNLSYGEYHALAV